MGCGTIRNKFDIEYGNHVMDSFKFCSGRILENVNVEYYTSGVPRYDDDGNIINAVVYCSSLVAEHSILGQFHDFIQSNDFDDDEYFFIKIMSLGAPGSCSPSTTGLKYNFPHYTFKDRVNFKKQFLFDKFKIKKCCGLVGEGLGGLEVFTWACEYPDDMGFIIVLNSTVKISGKRYVVVKCVEAIIDSSDEIYSDEYSPSLSKLSVAIYRLLFTGYLPNKVFNNLSNDEIDVLMEDYVDEGLFMDIHDIKSRNDCILEYDVEDKLSDIKAKSLILGTPGLAFSNPEKDILFLENSIKDSKVILFEYEPENYYEESDYSQVGEELISFLELLKK